VRQFQLALRSVKNAFPKRDGKTDARIQDLIVVREVADVAAEIINVKAQLVEPAFAGAKFKIIAVRGLHRQPQHAGLERLHLRRTG
jgi:hypothetical protein